MTNSKSRKNQFSTFEVTNVHFLRFQIPLINVPVHCKRFSSGGADFAKIIEEAAGGRSAQAQELAKALLEGRAEVRLFAATDRWTSSPLIRLERGEIEVASLPLRIYYTNLILGLLREMSFLRNISDFLEHLKALADTAARAA